MNCCFFPKETGVMAWYNNNNNEIKPFFFLFSFFLWFSDCLSLLFMLLFGYSIAGDRSGPNCAPSCTTSSDWTNVRPRDTWPLPGRWDTAHNTAHARTPKKKKSLFFYLLFIHDDLANMVSISLIFPFLCWPAFPCVCEYHVKDALTYLLASRERERERERQCEPKGTTMWNKNFIIGETNQRTWKTNWSLPMSTGFFFFVPSCPACCVCP